MELLLSYYYSYVLNIMALAIVLAAGCTFLGLLFRHFLFVHVLFYIYSHVLPLCSYS